MKFAAVYALIVGVSMFGMWVTLLVKRRVPEIETEPYRIMHHLAGEFMTAIALVASGIALLANWSWGLRSYLLAIGMLLYTVVVSPGYYAQRREWPMVGMFGAVLALTVVSLFLVMV